ncbi:MAG: hypothetical protein SGJ20_07825 [Planctomycetota bacterium]|nr:hypothetical protein [Planctomycetota bacterium]
MFAVTFGVFVPGFDTNDDAIMSMIASGVGFGLKPDEHLIFSNVLIGQVLKTMYTWLPSVPWYGCYLVALQALANVIMVYCTVRRGYSRPRIRCYLIYFFVAGLYFLNNLQFTTTAFMVGQSGALLSLLSLQRYAQGERSWRIGLTLCLAAPLMILGGLIRFESLMLLLVLLMPVWAFFIYVRPLRRQNFLRVAALASIVIFVSLACKSYNTAYYEADPAWRDFYSYNRLRVNFNDLRLVRYSEESKTAFDSVGWSKNDAGMIYEWYYDDEQRYSAANLTAILEGYNWARERISPANVVDGLYITLQQPKCWILLMAYPFLLYYVDRRHFNLQLLTGVSVLAWTVIAGLIMFEKLPPDRVWLPALGFPFAVGLLLTNKQSEYASKLNMCWTLITCPAERASERKYYTIYPFRIFIALLALNTMFCLWNANYSQHRRSRARVRQHKTMDALLASPHVGKDKLIVGWANSLPYEGVRIFASANSIRHLHLLVLGWPQRTPLHQAIKDRFGIDDLARSLYQRKDIFLVAEPGYQKMLADYIQEHYQAEIGYLECPKVSNLNIVQGVRLERAEDSKQFRMAAPPKSKPQ